MKCLEEKKNSRKKKDKKETTFFTDFILSIKKGQDY